MAEGQNYLNCWMSSLSRRRFIGLSAVAVGGWPVAVRAVQVGAVAGTDVGLQLYSVRDEMNRDAAGTLKKLKEIGYTQVEHAGYWKGKFYGYPAKEFATLLRGIGLDMISGHVAIQATDYNDGSKEFSADWREAVKSAAAVGQRYIITPSFPEPWRKDKDTVLRYLEVFNACGSFCKSLGVKFGYHNHTMEFDGIFSGASLYELILQYTDPSLVALQLDVGLLYAAGVQPQAMIRGHAGRFELMHVKDEFRKPGGGERGQGYESTVLGQGELKLAEIVRLGQDTGGVKYLIVEQESFGDLPELECARKDYQFMKTLL
jgi:sugar phosphate isomerase/epimerase